MYVDIDDVLGVVCMFNLLFEVGLVVVRVHQEHLSEVRVHQEHLSEGTEEFKMVVQEQRLLWSGVRYFTNADFTSASDRVELVKETLLKYLPMRIIDFWPK